MTRKHSPDGDDSGDQSNKYSERFGTLEAKAREALKHDLPGQCDVTVRAHNKEYNPDRQVTNHLIRTDEEWIEVQTWTVVGGASGLTVTDTGQHLVLEIPELDQDRIADRIVRESLHAIDSHRPVGQPVEPFTTLVRHAESVAHDLVTEWESESEHVVRNRIHEGVAGWTGTTAWAALEEEAMSVEGERATARFIDEYINYSISDDVERTIQDISRTALVDAVTERRDRQTPHMDYAAEVRLTE